ncbi:hypothetical protein T01_11503 [Trichinella spiralis]|uniref:Uncharacterized protein n=1 Tax=Trichinella spiralis TaxID=6334 RepID=A0A0V1B8S4_TRISP|nr:hypothetical protein T01_11503 [Trichinella spiralis]
MKKEQERNFLIKDIQFTNYTMPKEHSIMIMAENYARIIITSSAFFELQSTYNEPIMPQGKFCIKISSC